MSSTSNTKGGGVGSDKEMGYDDELLTEISQSGGSSFIRGVKRLRTADALKGRSFLETKWELELSTRKRKDILALPGDGGREMCADQGNDIGKYPSPANLYVVGALLSSSTRKEETGPLVEESSEDGRYTPTADKGTPTNSAIIEGDEDLNNNAIGFKTGPNADVSTTTPDVDTENDIESNDDEERPCHMTFPVNTREDGPEEEEVVNLDCRRVLFYSDPDSTPMQEDAPENYRIEPNSTVVDVLEKDTSDVTNSAAETDTTGTSSTDENSIEDGSIDDIATDPESVKTVPSSMKLSALAWDDAELFSGFLSRAKAKREANGGMTPNGNAGFSKSDHTHSPTPRARRALEQLDKNSPTPQKSQISTVKSETQLASPSDRAGAGAGSTSNENDPDNSETKTRRRSNRTRAARIPRPHAPPDVPHQIPMRRANGTEFIFLKRTEAQQTALTTRANTKRNKGSAQMPKYRLKTLTKEQGEESTEGVSSGVPEASAPLSKPTGKKQVSWNEQNLVEYAYGRDPEDEGHATVEDDQGKPGKKGDDEKMPKRLSTPRATKRVLQHLGTPTSSSSSVISSTSGHTPMPKKTKLAPRSPKVDATLSSTRSRKTLTGRRNGQSLPVKSGRKPNGVK